MKNKKLKKSCAVFLCFLLLACGCASGDAPSGKQGGREEILIWTWDDTFNVKAAKLAAERYRENHPEVEVVVETKEREEVLSDVKLALSAKVYDNLPDVIMIEDYDTQDVLQSYEDEFVDLTDLIDYDQYVDYKRRLCGKDGRAYGIPFDCGTTALFYRLDIIEQAGYSEADMQNLTWSEYIEIGKKVYEETGTPMLTLDPTDLPLIRLIMQSCGEWYVDGDGTHADISDNEALRQALIIYRQLLEENLGVSVNGWNEFISAFQTGQVATVLSGGWIISSIRAVPEQSGLWRIAPIPTVDGNADSVCASNLGGSAWYILKNSRHSGLATDFMVEMFAENTAFMDELVAEIGLVPALKDATVLKSYYANDGFFGGQSATRLLIGFAAMVPSVNYGSKTYEIEDILESEFQNTLSGSDLDECLGRVQMKAGVVARE